MDIIKSLLIVILILLTSEIFAQSYDVITKIDRTKINCKVMLVSEKSIEIDPEGDIPFQILKRNEVATIKYSNGTEVKLGEVVITNTNLQPIKKKSWRINFKSGDLLSLAVDKLVGKQDFQYIIGNEIEVGAEAISLNKKTIEANYSFVDKSNSQRNIKVLVKGGGTFSNTEALLFIDGELIETKSVKYKNEYQWINNSIPNDRILITAGLKGFNTGSRLYAVIDLIDRPSIENAEKIMELRRNSSSFPITLIDEVYYLDNSVCYVGYFNKVENYYLSNDGNLHHIAVETDLHSAPSLNVRLIIDNKVVKTAFDDTGAKQRLINFEYTTTEGNLFKVSVEQKAGLNTIPRKITVIQIN